jgi:hypothetical protein
MMRVWPSLNGSALSVASRFRSLSDCIVCVAVIATVSPFRLFHSTSTNRNSNVVVQVYPKNAAESPTFATCTNRLPDDTCHRNATVAVQPYSHTHTYTHTHTHSQSIDTREMNWSPQDRSYFVFKL